MEKNIDLETVLKKHQSQFSIKFPNQLLFSANEVRKNSPHRSVCLTVADSQKTPLAVLKYPFTKTKLANDAIEKEYKTLVKLHQSQPQVVPTPLGMHQTEIGSLALYEYRPHQMLYRSLYETKEVFSPQYFTKAIDWLISWNQTTVSGSISKEFIDQFQTKFFEVLSKRYEKLTPLLSQIWSGSKPLMESLIQDAVPTVSMHGDFNVLNMGIQKNGQLVIFDWEDSQPQYPILFDFFYFMIGFYWYLFDDRFTNISAEFVAENINKINALVDQYLQKYEQIFSVSLKSVNALFILFLFHSLYMDLDEKRQSEESMILRWLDMLTHLGGTNFLTHNLEIRQDFYIKKLNVER